MPCILAHGPTPLELAVFLLAIALMVACPPALMVPFGSVTRRRRQLGILAGVLLNLAGILLFILATGFPDWGTNRGCRDLRVLLFFLIPELAGPAILISIVLAVEAVICHDRWRRIQSARKLPPTPPTP